MPKFIIHRNYGYVGTHAEEEIEADDEIEAERAAEEFAMSKVEWWVERVGEEPKN